MTKGISTDKPAAEDILAAMPAELPENPTTEDTETYYKGLATAGVSIIKGWFEDADQGNLTARRPFNKLPKNPYLKVTTAIETELLKKNEALGKRKSEVLTAIALGSQQLWLERTEIPNLEKLTWLEKVDLVRLKNEDKKKDLLGDYLSQPDEKRKLQGLKARVTNAKKGKGVKTEPKTEKAPKAKSQLKAEKVKSVIGKKEIDALIKQAETVEKELDKAKSDFDKAINKVRQVHSKLKEELVVTKRLMEMQK